MRFERTGISSGALTRATRALVTLSVAAASFACSEPPTEIQTDTIIQPPQELWMTATIHAGDAQTGMAGDTLRHRIAVRVLGNGKPVNGFVVRWLGGAGWTPPLSSTDANGVASVPWTLPTKSGTGTAHALIEAPTGIVVKTIDFAALVLPGPAASITGVSGSGQRLTANGCQRSVVLQAFAKDRFNNTVFAPSIQWSVVEGPFFLSAHESGLDQPDATGRVQATVTRTGAPGVGRIRATLPSAGVAVDYIVTVTDPQYIVKLVDIYGDDLSFQSEQACSGSVVDTISVGTTMQFVNARYYESMQIEWDDDAFPRSAQITIGATHHVLFSVPGTYRYREASMRTISGNIVVRP